MAEARLLLARLLFTFDLTLNEPGASTWRDQKAWLVYAPKALHVKLQQR